jgi:5'(3')-deoxyribonucleotidase
MRIAMDLDGVMADWTAGWVRAFNREFAASTPGSEVAVADVTSWNGNLDLTHFETQHGFFEWLKTVPDFWANLPSYPGAVEAVKDLKLAGHMVDFVTHRPDWAHQATYRWLDVRGLLAGSDLIFEADKGTTGHDLYVDDAPHVLLKLAEKRIPCIRFWRPWNEGGAGMLADGWDDVHRIVRNLEIDRTEAAPPSYLIPNPPPFDEFLPAPATADLGILGEVRIVDPKSGGEKGQKLVRYDLLPHDALDLVATHFGLGARKYADRNWERGYAWGLSYGAALRHLSLFWQGEDMDEDPALGQPSPHLAAAAFHILALLTFQQRGIGTDDRGVA